MHSGGYCRHSLTHLGSDDIVGCSPNKDCIVVIVDIASVCIHADVYVVDSNVLGLNMLRL